MVQNPRPLILGQMTTLLDQIPLEQMNTSMTINATAAWLLGLYIANAEDQGIASEMLRGTTQNDIVKEYLSRGTYIFPPEASKRLIVDMVAIIMDIGAIVVRIEPVQDQGGCCGSSGYGCIVHSHSVRSRIYTCWNMLIRPRGNRPGGFLVWPMLS